MVEEQKQQKRKKLQIKVLLVTQVIYTNPRLVNQVNTNQRYFCIAMRVSELVNKP